MPNNPNEPSPIRIFTTEEFERQLRSLLKRYRSIQSDIQPIIEQLQASKALGDKIQNVGYPVFKVRVQNSDIQKGKSGGYRLIYYMQLSSEIVLITIYAKSDRQDISAKEVRRIIELFVNELY